MPPKGSKANEIFIDQDFLDERCPVLTVRIVPESRLDVGLLDWLLQPNGTETETETNGTPTRLVGMHTAYSKSGLLAALAISIRKKILLVTDIMKSKGSLSPSRRALRSKLLSNASGFSVVAFNAHELVLALRRDMGLTCERVIDLLSLPPRTRDVVQMVKTVTGARLELFEDRIRDAFQVTIYKKDHQCTLAQQAWFAQLIADRPEAKKDLLGVPVIDSSSFAKAELDVLVSGMEGLLLRDLAKPSKETYNIPAGAVKYEGNKVSWNQNAYSNRLKSTSQQIIKANLPGDVTFSASISSIRGKQANLRVQHLNELIEKNVRSFTVEGRAAPTKAEQHHSLTILRVLQRKEPLFNNPWMSRLFPSPSADGTPNMDDVATEPSEFTTNGSELSSAGDPWASAVSVAVHASETLQEENFEWATAGDDPWTSAIDSRICRSSVHMQDVVPLPNDPLDAKPLCDDDESYPTQPEDQPSAQQLAYQGPLNASQLQAVHDMLDCDRHISIIQGPPGTGKTTVIAAYVAEILSQPRRTCLVIAQSNVAIKNVGEKLFNSGITDWILVVSSEFLTGWHEHIYEQLPKANILSSHSMRHPIHARTILCTLSMLSNSKFIQLTRHLHVESIIVEEASQIPMNSYMPVISLFSKHLKKLSFIGDDKQLPPYASENSEALASVFENMPLLLAYSVLLLDIQYRMPSPAGNFISREVYTGLLKSWDGHPVQSSLSIQFLDVNGAEEPEKTSFKNPKEMSAVISIASLLYQQQKSFKIITPYESQRDLVEQNLDASGLPWANTCFTVDSFQGNEGDFIIISIVRTKSIGFLKDLRRSNVMLSRARRGMFICSSKAFLQGPGARHTLIGKMAEEWSSIEGGWIEAESLDVERLAEQLYVE